MIKILHCADIHFDRKFSLLPPHKAFQRKEDVRETFLKLIKLAEAVDILIISGDLFDSDVVTPETMDFLGRAFRAIPETKVFIAAGNHDCLNENSAYGFIDFPENVHVFGEEIECVKYNNANVYGVSFSKKHMQTSLLKGFVAPKGECNIMVMHGDVKDESDYNPISISDLEKSNISYLALGHQHKFKKGNNFAYSGTLEPHSFGETGEFGAAYVHVDEKSCAVDFVKLAKREYVDIEIDVSGMLSMTTMADAIKNKIENDNNIYNITLIGETDGIIKAEILAEMLDVFHAKIEDKTTANADEHSPLLSGAIEYIKKNGGNEKAVKFVKRALSGIEV